jgi:hypothetical protein
MTKVILVLLFCLSLAFLASCLSIFLVRQVFIPKAMVRLAYGICAALIRPLANSRAKCGDDLWMSSCCKICPKSKEVASAIVERAWCDCGRQSYITKIINTMQANYSRANCERVECMKLEAGSLQQQQHQRRLEISTLSTRRNFKRMRVAFHLCEIATAAAPFLFAAAWSEFTAGAVACRRRFSN